MARAPRAERASRPPRPATASPAADVAEPPVAKRVAHTLGAPDRTGRRSMGLAGRPRRPRHARLPRGRERLRRRLARRARATSSTPSSTRSRPAPRRPTRRVPARKGPWWYASRTVEGLAVPDPLPGREPRGDGDRAGRAPRRERARPATRPSSSSARSTSARVTGLLAWSADRNGHEVFTMRVRDLAAGHRPAGPCSRARTTARRGRPTSATSSTPCPTTPCGPYQVWRHEAGHARRPTTCSSTRRTTSASTWTSSCSRSGAYVVITNEANTSTDVLVLPADQPAGRAAARRPSAGRTSSTGSTTGATASSSSPTSTPRTSRS